MHRPNRLTIDLISDTTFGCGSYPSGQVDEEIEHDLLGLPRVSGKTLHGLLRDTWLSMEKYFEGLSEAASSVLGTSRDLGEKACLRIGDGCVEQRVKAWLEYAMRPERNVGRVTPDQVLEALTGVRRQTSQDRQTGAPAEGTLRSTRVIIRGLRLAATLHWLHEPSEEEIQVLALVALGTRNVGLARNRGRGHVCILLDGDLEQTRNVAGQEVSNR